MGTKFCSENLKEGNNLEDLGVDGGEDNTKMNI
jgi:hypothetical protein